jgi:hypothetical protein
VKPWWRYSPGVFSKSINPARTIRSARRTSRLDYLGNAAFQPEVAVSFAALRQLAK